MFESRNGRSRHAKEATRGHAPRADGKYGRVVGADWAGAHEHNCTISLLSDDPMLNRLLRKLDDVLGRSDD